MVNFRIKIHSSVFVVRGEWELNYIGIRNYYIVCPVISKICSMSLSEEPIKLNDGKLCVKLETTRFSGHIVLILLREANCTKNYRA